MNKWGHDCMEKVRLQVEKLAWATQEVEQCRSSYREPLNKLNTQLSNAKNN